MTLGAAVLSFAAVAGLLTLTPGLDTALVLRAAITLRRRDAVAVSVGIIGGLLVWGAAASVGATALLAASGADPLLVGLVLAAVHGLLTAVWFTVLVVLGQVLAPVLRRPRVLRSLDGVTGAALVGFGIRLALPTR